MIKLCKYVAYNLWNVKKRVPMASEQVPVASERVPIRSEPVPIGSERVPIRSKSRLASAGELAIIRAWLVWVVGNSKGKDRS